MKYVDEFREPEVARRTAEAIARVTTRPWTLMEICGGQTHSIVRHGIDQMLPEGISLLHGPGCPVCVTPAAMIDAAIAIAAQPGVIFCSFGDMLRVPGESGSLNAAKARGADVRMVYSPLDALAIARSHPDRQVVFFAIGFETTAPATAMAVLQAEREELGNFSLLVSHVLVPPAIEALLGDPANGVQGFLAAGHVCTVMGYREYEPIARQFRIPIVVTGFEPLDLLQGIYRCILQLEQGRAEVENQYSRIVRRDGNRSAQDALARVFVVQAAALARHGRDSRERPRLGAALRAFRRVTALPRHRRRYRTHRRMHQRRGPAGPEEARRVPRVRHALHSRASARRDHGVVGGSLRRLLPLSPAIDGREGVMTEPPQLALGCAIGVAAGDAIELAHGGGGLMTRRLIDDVFRPAFARSPDDLTHDGAVLDIAGARLAFTTDSYVVRPLFFPGGDIGSLAVNGTVNDLAMCGAEPLYLSVGLVIEEGFAMDDLRRVVASMRQAAMVAGVQVVTGDTKVVERGKGDGLYINTSGVGRLLIPQATVPQRVQVGDAVIVSGDIGRHGIAVMAIREGLGFETTITSDCAALATPVRELLLSGIDVHCLRDLTRGGLATALIEIAEAGRVVIRLENSAIPLSDPVRGACEILGLDPLYVANEGRFVAFVPREAAGRAVTILQPHGKDVAVIGYVEAPASRGEVQLSTIGGNRSLDMLTGEQLPRIC